MTPLVDVNSLVVFRPASHSSDPRVRRAGGRVAAVNGASLALPPGESLGIVGESGAGKTTLAKAILRLIPSDAGEIHFEGQSIQALRGAALAGYRRRAQMIFANPRASLNPRLTIEEAVAEPLRVHARMGAKEAENRVEELTTGCGLAPEMRKARPADLSDADCQRAAIARILTINPALLIADDPVAGLDAPPRAQILNLLGLIAREAPLGMILMARDVGTLRRHCQQLAVMYLGRIVEAGPMEEVLARPRHPYTQALLASTPQAKADAPAPRVTLSGETPSPADLPPGCAFHPRCARAMTTCAEGTPPVRRVDGSVSVYCHLYSEPTVGRR